MSNKKNMSNKSTKDSVKDFWENASCGEELYLKGVSKEDYTKHASTRYTLEPEILKFADFKSFESKKVLEIGVGLGADQQKIVESGAISWGIDLTPRAINHTKRRLELNNLISNLQVSDAENLPFENDFFDIVYSWGVLHHSPDTPKAISELYKVLKPGGYAKIMVYHKKSIVGIMLWIRYGLLQLKPFITFKELYDKHLESPGTKAYSRKEAMTIFSQFDVKNISTPLTHADLLTSEVGQRHKGILLQLARHLWPRYMLRKFFPKNGLGMMLDIEKRK